MTTRRLLTAVAVATLTANLASAADWPAYRAGSTRTAKTSERLRFPLSLAWRYVPARPPQPAWPELSWRDFSYFDYAPHPVIAGGLVYFGSTSDNTLWALDIATGEEKWGFTTGAPIRFAPAIRDGKAYVVSDDGHLYCLDAASGTLLWKFHAGVNDRRIIGNGHMISRWPIRSGLAVLDGVVHFASGMWPSEGVFVFAVDAKTGKEVWCNDTNLEYRMLCDAAGSSALSGNMPQGYLAAAGNKVMYNNAQNGMRTYDAKTGENLGHCGDYRRGAKGANGSLLVVDEEEGVFHGEADSPMGFLVGWMGRPPADWVIAQTAVVADDTLIRYERDQSAHQASIMAGRLVEPDENPPTRIVATIRGTDKEVWEQKIDADAVAYGIAVGSGSLVLTFTNGEIWCFKNGAGNAIVVGPKKAAEPRVTANGSAAVALQELATQKVTRGYALVLGETDTSMAQALAAGTDLKIICALEDESKVASERIRLRDMYGNQIIVDYLAGSTTLPYPPYFANLIVVDRMPRGLSAVEVERMQRPCGGILVAGGKVNVRGKLPGAMDWDSKVTADEHVRGPLEFLWFGEPGGGSTGAQVVAPPPIVFNGRMLVTGPRKSVCVDAYNGTILWSLPGVKDHKRAFASIRVDDHYVYMQGKTLDAQTGEEVQGGNANVGGKAPAGAPPDWKNIAKGRGLTPHPVTGRLMSKVANRGGKGCGGMAFSSTLKFERGGTTTYHDYEDESGVRYIAGTRPGCGVTIVGALGLILSREGMGTPEYQRGLNWTSNIGSPKACICIAYPHLASYALVQAPRRSHEDWAIYTGIPSEFEEPGEVRHIRANFGAPGDRRDNDRDHWLTWPRPKHSKGAAIFPVPHNIEYHEGHEFFRRNAERLEIAGTDKPWVYTYGCKGLKRISWDLYYTPPGIEGGGSTPAPEPNATAKPYTMRLHFAELENDEPGQRVFDVKLGDKVVLEDFDIFAEAVGKNEALVKEFKSVSAMDKLALELVPKSGIPIICGMEIIAERPGPIPEPIILKQYDVGRKTVVEPYSEEEREYLKRKRRGMLEEE